MSLEIVHNVAPRKGVAFKDADRKHFLTFNKSGIQILFDVTNR